MLLSEARMDHLLGERIKKARKASPAMTSELVASFLQISLSELAELEAGHLRPTADQIMLLADLMDVSPSWFFDGLNAALRVPAHR